MSSRPSQYNFDESHAGTSCIYVSGVFRWGRQLSYHLSTEQGVEADPRYIEQPELQRTSVNVHAMPVELVIDTWPPFVIAYVPPNGLRVSATEHVPMMTFTTLVIEVPIRTMKF
jgi:hypothetical protein